MDILLQTCNQEAYNVVIWKSQEDFENEEAIPVMKLGLVCASQVLSNRPED